MFVLIMQFLWRYIDDLVGKGLEFHVIAELLLYISASLVPMALPLAILMSSLMTFGNMGEFYELTAIKASGISLQRIMFPVVIVSIIIGTGAFFFANDIMPYTNLKMRTLLYDVTMQRPELQIVEGEFYNGIDGYSVRIGKKNQSNNMLYDLMVYNHTQGKGNTSVTIADSGSMILTHDEKKLIFTLYSGYSYNEMSEERKREKTYPHRKDLFKEEQIIIDLTGLNFKRSDETIFKSHHQMMNLSQLQTKIDSANKEINQKYSQMESNLENINFFKLRQRNRSRKPPPSTGTTERLMTPHRKNVSSRQSEKIQQSDSLYKGTAMEINIDSVYASLTPLEKKRVLMNAKGYSKNTKTYVTSNHQNISHKIERLRRFEVEYQRKFTIAFACVVFLLIGAPLGAIIRKGGMGLSLVLSVLFFIFYYILSLIGEKMVRENVLPDYQGMWLASAVFFITGSFLTYKATTDSSILNFDTYANAFKRLFNISRLSVVEQIMLDKDYITEGKPKLDKIISSLESFSKSTDEVIAEINSNIRIADATMKLFTVFQPDSTYILFERLYRNIMRTIVSSEFFNIHQVRSKLMLFPGFTERDYKESRVMKFVLILLAALPPLTLIALIRSYIKSIILRNKVKYIRTLSVELISYLRFQIELTDE